MKREVIVPCLRVTDVKRPYVPSKKQKCGKCGADIWVADTTLSSIASRGFDVSEVKFNCVIQCAQIDKEAKLIPLTEEQMKEVKGAMV